MDVTQTTAFGSFEWDSCKNASNICKHGLDFRDALCVFQDQRAIIAYDDAHSGGEDRYRIIGNIRGILVVLLVFTERRTVVRIISARKATRHEVKEYERNFPY